MYLRYKLREIIVGKFSQKYTRIFSTYVLEFRFTVEVDCSKVKKRINVKRIK